MTRKDRQNLTGVWHGLYSYPAYREPVYFVATLIHSGTALSGTIHESEKGVNGTPLTLYASVWGAMAGTAVDFTKTYDGSGGWSHSVEYSGHLNGDATEIEGAWSFPSAWSGRFLMIRSSHASETVARRVFEKA